MIELQDANVKFIVKPYDPIEDAIQKLNAFNSTREEERQQSEEELLALLVHQVRHGG